MFTQLLGFNTNKCNGCSKRCILDAQPHKRKKDRFIPTIDNKPFGFYCDKNKKRHNLRPYATKFSAIDMARTIARCCPRYNPIRSTVTATEPQQCTGCDIRCKISSTETPNGFMPTIQKTVIYTFLNQYNIAETVFPRPTPNYAQELGLRIAKRCDFYKKHR